MRKQRQGYIRWSRPVLEILEQRLPPGDTALGVLMPGALFESTLDDSTFIIHRSSFDSGSSFILHPSSFDSDSSFILRPSSFSSVDLATRPISQTMWPDPVVTLTDFPSTGCSDWAALPATLRHTPNNGPPARRIAPHRAAMEANVASTFSGSQALPGNPMPRGSASLTVTATRQSLSPVRSQAEPGNEVEGVVANAAETNYGALPFYFEQNLGQADESFDFVARTAGYTLGLSATEAIFSFQSRERQRPADDIDVGCVKSSQTHQAIVAPVRPRGLDAPYEENDCALETPPSVANASSSDLLRMQLAGAKPQAAVGLDPLVTKINYFLGNDPSQWHTNVPTFAKVQYDEIYPGIDVVYYAAPPSPAAGREAATPPSPAAGRGDGGEGALEYDFIVSPGADPNQIQLNFTGADSIKIDTNGDLVLSIATDNGQRTTDLRQLKPYIYQEINGTRQQVAGEFRIQNSESSSSTDYSLLSTDYCSVAFDVGAYDASRPLVIDPMVLSYSTYLGGAFFDNGKDIAVDAAGNAYVTGSTASPNFPVTPGAFDTTHSGQTMVYVAKLNAAGSELVYATFLGGPSTSFPYSIAVDAASQAYVTGVTGAGFPTTPGAFDTTYNGNTDGFVAELNATGTALVYSTYLGGTSFDDGYGIAVDGAGSAYVSGATKSTDFPTTPGAFDTSFNGGVYDAFAVKLSADGSSLAYSTLLGGLKTDTGGWTAVNSAGEGYFAGGTLSFDFPTTPEAFDTTYNVDVDGFVTKLSADGSALVYSTFLGGRDRGGGLRIFLDGAGDAYLTGNTRSANFPTTPGAFDTTFNGDVDAYVSKLSADGRTLVYSTYLGGGKYDGGLGIAVDGAGNTYVTGFTPGGFPTTPDAFDTTYNGGVYDSFLARLNAAGSALTYSTYLGGREGDVGYGVAVVVSGDVYVVGGTGSPNFPKTAGAFDTTYNGGTDAFVMKLRVQSRDPLKVNSMIP